MTGGPGLSAGERGEGGRGWPAGPRPRKGEGGAGWAGPPGRVGGGTGFLLLFFQTNFQSFFQIEF